MMFYRNRFIGKIFSGIFNLIYKILAVFSLQPVLFVLLVDVILFFTGVLENPTVKLVSDVALIAGVIYAVVGTAQRLLGLDKIKKSKGAQILPQPNNSDGQVGAQTSEPVAEVQASAPVENPATRENPAVVNPNSPTYFRIKNRPGYVMAEYSDRYELYLSSGGKLIKVRTDFKNGQGDNNDRLF